MMTVAVQTPESAWRQEKKLFEDQHHQPFLYNGSMPEGAIYWYEEETLEDNEDVESDVEYTEVTYESDCPTEDDILLGTLPPAPPLADPCNLIKIDAVSEQRLLDAMRKKRDEEPKKTTVPGTTRGEPLPKQMLPPQPHRSKKFLLHQDSPTGVWEHPQARERSGKKVRTPRRRRSASSLRLKKLDAILLVHDERRAFSLHSANPRQQIVSLQKFWRERIDHQMESVERQLASLEKSIARTEKELGTKRKEDK